MSIIKVFCLHLTTVLKLRAEELFSYVIFIDYWGRIAFYFNRFSVQINNKIIVCANSKIGIYTFMAAVKWAHKWIYLNPVAFILYSKLNDQMVELIL